jgi:hypothetical protein
VAPTGSTGAARRSTAPPSAPKGGRGDRAQSDGPRQGGHEAPPRRGRRGHAARPDREPGEPPRQPDAGRHPRRGPARPGTARPTPPPPGQAPRRQGLRPSPLPARVSEPGHHPAHRPTRGRQRRTAGPAPLEGRADAGLAGPVPAPRRPPRTPSRRARRLRHLGLRHHLRQADQEVLSRTLVRQLSFCTSEPSPVVEGLGDGLVRPPPERPSQDEGRPRWGAGQLEPRDQAADLRDAEGNEGLTGGGPPPFAAFSPARSPARGASASIARVTWRCQPRQLRTS